MHHLPDEPERDDRGLPERWLAALAPRRLLAALVGTLKLAAALVYFVLDEATAAVGWLRRRFTPLAWYFNAVKRLAIALRRQGLGSPSPAVRAAVPFAALPFVLVPMGLLFPAKLYFLKFLVTAPLYALGGLLAAKLLSAVFVKNTWDILRRVGRRNALIARVDDQWQRLEAWAKATARAFAATLRASLAYRILRERAWRLRRLLQPVLARLVAQGRQLDRQVA